MKSEENLNIPVTNENGNRQQLTSEIASIQEQVKGLSIMNDEQYSQAAALGQEIKRRQKMVTDFFKPIKDAANKAHREACSQEHVMLDPLTEAEKIIKRAMNGYMEQKERERRAAEEEAKRKAAEEAQRLLDEAAKLEEEGKTLASEAVLQAAEVVEAAPVNVPQAVKAEGVSTRTDWEATVTDESKVPTSIVGVVIRPVDMSAVTRLVRACKGKIEIPGIEIREVKKTALRG